jgi:hypothetical protein
MLRFAHISSLSVLTGAFAAAANAYAFNQLPPRPIEIDANRIFHEAFAGVMQQESDDWQLQPERPTGPAPSGRPPFEHEEMTWRKPDNLFVSVRYSRYSSSDEAAAALKWALARISVATAPVKMQKNFGGPVRDLADEAYIPATGGSIHLRRGQFVFMVSVTTLPNRPLPFL